LDVLLNDPYQHGDEGASVRVQQQQQYNNKIGKHQNYLP
jgi:hypothetical protein